MLVAETGQDLGNLRGNGVAFKQMVFYKDLRPITLDEGLTTTQNLDFSTFDVKFHPGNRRYANKLPFGPHVKRLDGNSGPLPVIFFQK